MVWCLIDDMVVPSPYADVLDDVSYDFDRLVLPYPNYVFDDFFLNFLFLNFLFNEHLSRV